MSTLANEILAIVSHGRKPLPKHLSVENHFAQLKLRALILPKQ